MLFVNVYLLPLCPEMTLWSEQCCSNSELAHRSINWKLWISCFAVISTWKSYRASSWSIVFLIFILLLVRCSLRDKDSKTLTPKQCPSLQIPGQNFLALKLVGQEHIEQETKEDTKENFSSLLTIFCCWKPAIL